MTRPAAQPDDRSWIPASRRSSAINFDRTSASDSCLVKRSSVEPIERIVPFATSRARTGGGSTRLRTMTERSPGICRNASRRIDPSQIHPPPGSCRSPRSFLPAATQRSCGKSSGRTRRGRRRPLPASSATCRPWAKAASRQARACSGRTSLGPRRRSRPDTRASSRGGLAVAGGERRLSRARRRRDPGDRRCARQLSRQPLTRQDPEETWPGELGDRGSSGSRHSASFARTTLRGRSWSTGFRSSAGRSAPRRRASRGYGAPRSRPCRC